MHFPQRTIVCCTLLAVLVAMPLAYGDALAPGLVTPDELKWTTGPTGNPQARITGDAAKPGMYMYRSRFPAITKCSRISIRMSGWGWWCRARCWSATAKTSTKAG